MKNPRPWWQHQPRNKSVSHKQRAFTNFNCSPWAQPFFPIFPHFSHFFPSRAFAGVLGQLRVEIPEPHCGISTATGQFGRIRREGHTQHGLTARSSRSSLAGVRGLTWAWHTLCTYDTTGIRFSEVFTHTHIYIYIIIYIYISWSLNIVVKCCPYICPCFFLEAPRLDMATERGGATRDRSNSEDGQWVIGDVQHAFLTPCHANVKKHLTHGPWCHG